MSVLTSWRGEDLARVLVVTIDRPDRRNAVDLPTLMQLQKVQAEAVAGGARVIVLTGSDGAFCAGADLNGVEQGDFMAALSTVLLGLGAATAVTMAAVDGPALGAGTQLAAACDLRVATASSPFGVPAARLGLAVDAWTVERLTSQLGPSIARSMLLAAQTWNAEQLNASGFVHRIGDLERALVWAEEIAGLAPLSIAAHKLMLQDAPTSAAEAAVRAAWSSADATEGRASFLEKRRPRFTGT
jgi:enoyl-CoA hydratase